MKIAIIGYSGSGKSTLAQILGSFYNIPVLHLDTVEWCPNWVERDEEEGRKIVQEFLSKNESWVIDGNYKKFYRDERLKEADKIIFLDFSRTICLYRAFKRRIKYSHTSRPDMTVGCDEKMDFEFIRWIVHDSRTKPRRDSFREIGEKYKDKFTVLRTPKEVNNYINEYFRRANDEQGFGK